MKVSGFWALFLVLGATLVLFSFSSHIGGSLFPADLFATNCCDGATFVAAVSRKMKENDSSSRSKNKGDTGRMSLNDYPQPIDPVPTTVDDVEPGTIEHG